MHRPQADWEKYAKRNDPTSIEGRVFQGLQRLVAIRKQNQVLSSGTLNVISTGNEHVLGFVKSHGDHRVPVLANFSEEEQTISPDATAEFETPRILTAYELYTAFR